MASNKEFEKIDKIFKSKAGKKKPPKYEWQDFALRIIDELGIPGFKRGSVFKICKEYPKDAVLKCLNDTKELCKKGETWRYFFKLINLINK